MDTPIDRDEALRPALDELAVRDADIARAENQSPAFGGDGLAELRGRGQICRIATGAGAAIDAE